MMNKVIGIASQKWNLNSTSNLFLFRSDPQLLDSNGDCLITVFKRDEKLVLAAGDYVYARFAADNNSNIAALSRKVFSAVVVPHHGDAASANAVLSSKAGAKAFFSAGTHQGYGHPTAVSLNAHKAARYAIVNNPTEADIVRVRLM
ncbi:hypothetical protein FQZ97_978840 [compost metagenome]